MSLQCWGGRKAEDVQRGWGPGSGENIKPAHSRICSSDVRFNWQDFLWPTKFSILVVLNQILTAGTVVSFDMVCIWGNTAHLLWCPSLTPAGSG